MKKNLFDLTGRKAIVTGGYQGIGRAYVEGLRNHGAEVCIIDLNKKVIEAAKEMSMDGGVPVHAVAADLADRTTRQQTFDACLEKLGGRLDILVNNAGINIRNADALNYPYEDWDKMFAVNVESVFYFCQMAARHMMANGYGKIINAASIAGMHGVKNASVYSATKAAVILMSEALSNEWAAKGVRVNSICPGFTATPLAKHSMDNPERMKEVYAKMPIGRIAQPEDLAGTVVYLASDASDFVTGVHVPVDGGASSNGV